MVEAAQVDIFIPLQRRERLSGWASLAREQDIDVGTPAGVATFADWLRDNGHAPAGVSHEGLQLLVAAMYEWEWAKGAADQTTSGPAPARTRWAS